MPTKKPSFKQLQKHLAEHPELVADTTDASRTLVYLTGMSLDQEELSKVTGVELYEERFLYVIGLLRNPKTKIVFITSKEIEASIINYYFDLFARSASERKHMRKRWQTIVTTHSKSKTMAQTILGSKALQKKIAATITRPQQTVLRCFNTSPDEKSIAELLGIPLNAAEPEHRELGSKSGAREVFKRAGLTPAYGAEHISSMPELIKAIRAIKREHPKTRQVVTKFNYSFSGVGNAIIPVLEFPVNAAKAKAYIEKVITPCETELTAKQYLKKLFALKGVVELWIDGKKTYSPSAQVVISPNHKVRIVSTHEQVVDEATKQVYLGARFPARLSFRPDVIKQARAIGEVLAKRGVIGPFGIDFITVKRGKKFATYPVEINLRKGGTTHPYHFARIVTDATYKKSGALRSNVNNKKVFYYSLDNIKSTNYVGMKPQELIDLVKRSGLAFDPATNIGITLHLMGALEPYGKFGVVCIARSPRAAEQLYELLVKMLNSYKANLAVTNPNTTTVGTLPLVQTKRLVNTFLKLVKIPSPSGKEDKLRAHLVPKLKALGVKVTVDKVGNIIGYKAANGHQVTDVPILLSAHMDTVQPCEPMKPVVRGDVIMSDGNTILGADNKAGIAYTLEVLALLQKHDIRHLPLEIVFSVREEQLHGGVEEMDFSMIRSPFGLVIDGAQAGEVDYQAPYIATTTITITGKAAHSGVEPERGISAIQIAADAISAMKLGRIDNDTTANIGLISGGTNRNSIPDNVSLTGEVRSISKRKLEAQLERMHKALEDAAEKRGGLLAIDSRVAVIGYNLGQSDPEIERIVASMRAVGLQPQLRKAGGGSDANVFIQKGIKAIDIGTGVQKPHTVEEHIHITDMTNVTQAILHLVTQV